jgi:hypothetical protein
MPDGLITDDGAVPHDQHAYRLVAAPGTPIHLCPSTLGHDPEGIKRRLNAMGTATLEMDRDGTLLMEVADVLVHCGDHLDEETGEIKTLSWLVLIDPAGETWSTTSQTVAGKIGQAMALRSAGLLPWPCPVQIVTRIGRRSGRRYHDVLFI